MTWADFWASPNSWRIGISPISSSNLSGSWDARDEGFESIGESEDPAGGDFGMVRGHAPDVLDYLTRVFAFPVSVPGEDPVIPIVLLDDG
jgi:hypothetical protein